MTELPTKLHLLAGVLPHEQHAAVRAERYVATVLFAAALLWIPAFYLELAGASHPWWILGRSLYLVVAVAFAAATLWHTAILHRRRRYFAANLLDIGVLFGAIVSVIVYSPDWNGGQWAFHLVLVALVALRLALPVAELLTPGRLLLPLLAGGALVALAGEGFYLLEPQVHSYADGLWLAFESSATVGYGDMAPSTPASRIFAMFVILLGYGLLSLVFATIAARFVGREERHLRREMHHDIRMLREQVAKLREELARQRDEDPGTALNRAPKPRSGDSAQ